MFASHGYNKYIFEPLLSHSPSHSRSPSLPSHSTDFSLNKNKRKLSLMRSSHRKRQKKYHILISIDWVTKYRWRKKKKESSCKCYTCESCCETLSVWLEIIQYSWVKIKFYFASHLNLSRPFLSVRKAYLIKWIFLPFIIHACVFEASKIECLIRSRLTASNWDWFKRWFNEKCVMIKLAVIGSINSGCWCSLNFFFKMTQNHLSFPFLSLGCFVIKISCMNHHHHHFTLPSFTMISDESLEKLFRTELKMSINIKLPSLHILNL